MSTEPVLQLFWRNQPCRVPLSTIVRFEGDGNYTRVHTRDRVYLMAQTLKALESNLADNRFARIHKQHMVNIERVQSWDFNHLTCAIQDNRLPVARRRVQIVKDAIDALKDH